MSTGLADARGHDHIRVPSHQPAEQRILAPRREAVLSGDDTAADRHHTIAAGPVLDHLQLATIDGEAAAAVVELEEEGITIAASLIAVLRTRDEIRMAKPLDGGIRAGTAMTATAENQVETEAIAGGTAGVAAQDTVDDDARTRSQ